MAEQEQPQKRGSGFFRLFERGVDTATRNNVTAYGYSVSITAAFAILQTSRSDTGVLEIFVFAGGGVVLFLGWPCPMCRLPRRDSAGRFASVAGERLLDDRCLCSCGGARVGRGAPDVAKRRVTCPKARWLYSPSCLEGVFSETQLA